MSWSARGIVTAAAAVVVLTGCTPGPLSSNADSVRLFSPNSKRRRRSGDNTSFGSTLPFRSISFNSLLATSMAARPLNDSILRSRAATGAAGSVVCASIVRLPN